MNFKYRIIDPCGVDKEQYKILHKELFPSAGIDDVWLEWYHEKIPNSDNRLSKTRTYGLFDDKRLIGIWSVESKILKNSNNALIKVGRCFAVGVSSDYRRMGLFVLLSQYAINQEKEKGEFEYILGFPQTGRSVIGGHLKAGWEEVKFVDIYSVNLCAIDGKYFRNDINNITDFSTILTNQSTENSFDEPALYRNIRFLEHPKLQYLNYSYGDAYIVLKNYSTFCHILEMRGSNIYLRRLIEVAKSVAKRHGLEEINVWNNSDAKSHKALIDCGFSKGAEHGLPITIIAVRIKAREKIEINNYNFGMGVEEGY